MEQRISVIIPTLNEAEHIQCCLTPLQPLRAKGHEIILVDGGSEDTTIDLARPLVDTVVKTSPGRAEQMAAGVDASHHPILWFLHADTLIPQHAEEELLKAVGEHQWGRFNVTLSGRHPLLRVVETMINLRSCLTGIATGDQGIFVSRELYEIIGGMPRQPLMEDVEMSRLLKCHSRPACIKLPLQTSSRRWEENGILRTILLMWGLRAAYALGVPATRLATLYR
jgi:rSAM/selenodomain-associated transferase 2